MLQPLKFSGKILTTKILIKTEFLANCDLALENYSYDVSDYLIDEVLKIFKKVEMHQTISIAIEVQIEIGKLKNPIRLNSVLTLNPGSNMKILKPSNEVHYLG